MKPHILQLSPILIPSINDALASRYQVHRYYEQSDKATFLREYASLIRACVTGGHAGITRELMTALPKLEVVAVNGVGTDACDLAYAREHKIHITATLGALTDDVADLAIALMLATCRSLGAGERYIRNQDWQNGKPGLPLARRFSAMQVGIVGLGRVGRAVATRAAAFGCSISYTDLQAIPGSPHQFVPDLVTLAKGSDALIVAAAADKAQGIINTEVIDALGPNGFLVNIARGKLVNENDLIAALTTGRLAGAGLDVFADEPNVPQALLALDNVVLSPHRASATLEARTAMGEMVLTSLEQALSGRRPDHSVTT